MMVDDSIEELKKRLLALRITAKDNKNHNSAIIERIEEKYDLVLPELYKHFMVYGDCNLNESLQYQTIERTPWSDQNNTESIGSFFTTGAGVNNLEKSIQQYYERIPGSILPIANDSAGNLICIGVSGEASGKIYFWDHENELTAKVMLDEAPSGSITIDNYWDNIYLVANSFIEFIRSLQVKEEKVISDINSKIASINISDDFMEKMRLARERLESKERGGE
ncbi:SMI1/KNR4 family protein [Paenibacillus sp. HW567]|uniref:SMI1/KNR4 family protein n=1 Tax=Paenibacillus sp. HW567 TaxID=1034769 RepID=UPI000377A0A0|nr:SMI1/KNR4 family protein [Paenibacillus sp. HW567]